MSAIERIKKIEALKEEFLSYSNRPANWGADHADKLHEFADKLAVGLGELIVAFQKMREIALEGMTDGMGCKISEEKLDAEFEEAMNETDLSERQRKATGYQSEEERAKIQRDALKREGLK